MEKLADVVYEHCSMASFSVGGYASEMPLDPRLEVDGIGQIAFPINRETAEKLILKCEK